MLPFLWNATTAHMPLRNPRNSFHRCHFTHKNRLVAHRHLFGRYVVELVPAQELRSLSPLSYIILPPEKGGQKLREQQHRVKGTTKGPKQPWLSTDYHSDKAQWNQIDWTFLSLHFPSPNDSPSPPFSSLGCSECLCSAQPPPACNASLPQAEDKHWVTLGDIKVAIQTGVVTIKRGRGWWPG